MSRGGRARTISQAEQVEEAGGIDSEALAYLARLTSDTGRRTQVSPPERAELDARAKRAGR